MTNNFQSRICPDIFFSSQKISVNEIEKVDMEITNSNRMPLMCWDIFMLGYQNAISESRKRMEMNAVLSFGKKFQWKNDLETAFSENRYKALILTDKNQRILWVNDGFTAMTGYSKKEAINNSPKFLHGEKTTQESRRSFRENLLREKPFTEIITNYRKDKTVYQCEVKIIPLNDENTTHYLAFEREVV